MLFKSYHGFVKTCGSDRVVMDGDIKVCENCGTLQSAQVY